MKVIVESLPYSPHLQIVKIPFGLNIRQAVAEYGPLIGPLRKSNLYDYYYGFRECNQKKSAPMKTMSASTFQKETSSQA